MIEEAREEEFLLLSTWRTRHVKGRPTLSRRGAWRVLTAAWNQSIESVPEFKSANSRIERLTDIVHGIGVTATGAALAGPVVGILLWVNDQTFSLVWLGAVSIGILGIAAFNLAAAVGHCQAVIDLIFLAGVREHHIALSVSERELAT